jgi:hypothetical protein
LTNEDENENTSDEDGKPPALGRIIEMTSSGAPVSRGAQLVDKEPAGKIIVAYWFLCNRELILTSQYSSLNICS